MSHLNKLQHVTLTTNYMSHSKKHVSVKLNMRTTQYSQTQIHNVTVMCNKKRSQSSTIIHARYNISTICVCTLRKLWGSFSAFIFFFISAVALRKALVGLLCSCCIVVVVVLCCYCYVVVFVSSFLCRCCCVVVV